MALQTQGFTLSALPRAPNIPANVGAIDVKEIYDGVRQGLAAFENVRRAPASMALADATMASEAQQAAARGSTAGPLAEQTLTNIPLQNRALVAHTVSAEQAVAATEGARQRDAVLRQQAAADLAPDETGESKYEKALKEAHGLAGYNESAAALGNLQAQFPWLTGLKEHDGRLKAIGESQKAYERLAERQAMGDNAQQVAEINRQRSEASARLRADATIRAAGIRASHGEQGLLDRLSAINAALDADPNNEVLLADQIATQQVLNKRSATAAVDPNKAKSVETGVADKALTASQKAAAEARKAQDAFDAAVAGGDADEIAFAKDELKLANDNATARAALAADHAKAINQAKTKPGMANPFGPSAPQSGESIPTMTLDEALAKRPNKVNIGGRIYEKGSDGKYVPAR